MLSHFIARRYLFSSKSHSVINIISGLSILSIAMPVAAMIVLLSVFNGFEGLIKSMSTTFDADLTISSNRGATFDIDSVDSLDLDDIDGIDAISYILEQSVLLECDGRQLTTTMRGVDDNYTDVLPIDSAIRVGAYQVRLGELDRFILGQANAFTLGVNNLTDGYIDVYALRRSNFSTLLPFDSYYRERVKVAGIFSLDLENELNYALTSLRFSQKLFNYDGKASSLLIGIDNRYNVEDIKEQLKPILGHNYKIETQYQLKSTLYNIMNYEKWGIFFISLMVLIIASFSIIGALSMLIIEKRSDIYTLRAIGGNLKFVRSIFLSEGLLLTLLGGGIGATLGVVVTLTQQYFGIVEIPSNTFLTTIYPVEFSLIDLGIVVCSFLAITNLITWLTVHSLIKKQ